MDKAIAVSHPGKLGDALYCLPAIRHLSLHHGCPVDFFTSAYCQPLTELFEAQSCVRKVIILENYRVKHMFCGIQPWEMPVPVEGYEAVYQLGFRRGPVRFLADAISDSVGVPTGLPIRYEYPEQPTLNEPYIALAPGRLPRYRGLFQDFVRRSPLPVVVVGAKEEYAGEGIDKTGLDLLDTLPWIAHARAFVGTLSSPLVLANAFPIPKIAVQDGVSWDLRHVQHGPLNHYPLNPTSQQLLEILGLAGYSKVLHPKDYLWLGEAQHVSNMRQLLEGEPYRFEHQHRHWEYGIALRALKENQVKTVLDVGGGGSVFAPAAAYLGMEVTQVDPSESGQLAFRQGTKLNKPLRYVRADFFDFHSKERFDAVTSLSVIEHVQRDLEFFLKLLDYVRESGLLVLTMDFHPSGMPLTEGHLRTYNEQKLLELAFIARSRGFEQFMTPPNYLWQGPHVNAYNFASLIMRKVR